MFYVVHYPVMIVGTGVLVRTGVDEGPVVAIAVLALALVACTGLALARPLIPVRWLFSAPGRPAARS